MPRNVYETQQVDWLMPPMARSGQTGGTGQTYAATGAFVAFANTSVVVLDLTTINGTPAKASVLAGADDFNPNPIGHYVELQADGDDMYFLFGDSVAAVASIAPTTVTGVQSGSTGPTGAALVNYTSNGCVKLVNGERAGFKLPVGAPGSSGGTVVPYDNADWGRYSPARYLGFRTNSGATAYMRIWQSST